MNSHEIIELIISDIKEYEKETNEWLEEAKKYPGGSSARIAVCNAASIPRAKIYALQRLAQKIKKIEVEEAKKKGKRECQE